MELIVFKNAGQNTLEICIAIIIGIILLLGAISTWNWFNKSMAERMDIYKSTRHVAITTQMGKQVNYTPDKLDIFSMSSTVGASPAFENPDLEGDPELQYCYDNFNQSQIQSEVLMNESMAASNEAADLMLQYINLKSVLGNFTVIDGNFFPPTFEGFDGLLFNGDYNMFYNSDFEVIEAQFEIKSIDPDLAYLTNLGIPIAASYISLEYIDVGIVLENTSEAKAIEAIEKRQQSQSLLQQASALLIECLGGEAQGPSACMQQCYNDYGIPAEQKANETASECYGGNFELCNQLLNETAVLQQQYQDCLTNCTD